MKNQSDLEILSVFARFAGKQNLVHCWRNSLIVLSTHWSLKQNGRHFADNIFKCIFLKEIFLWCQISLKFVPKSLIDKKKNLHWFKQGLDKPLAVPEPMIAQLTVVTRLQCVNIEASLISAWTKWPPFPDNIFKSIFVNEKFCILIWISLKLVSKGPIDT